MLAAPLRRRYEAGRLRPDVDAGRRTEPEPRRPLLECVAAARRQLVEVEADLVEVGVARLRERDRELDPLVRVRVPVVERLPVGREARRAGERRVRRQDVLLHRRERRDRLPGRAGRIGDARSRGSARVVLRAGDFVVLERRQLARVAAHVDRRLERRVRGEREHRAVARVERDDRAAVRSPAAAGRLRERDPVRAAPARPPAGGGRRS